MNGIIVIDKPTGKTSYDVVEDVKKALSVRKAGHTGTLDPMATGVLPVCINEATKLVQFLSMDTKDYRATMLLGVKTDTQDIEGKIIARDEPYVGLDDIDNVFNRFIGQIEQVPPRYSAIKFKGKSLHRWMRKGIAVDPPPRTVEIYNIGIDELKLPYITFSVSCSKGTYVRSLCSDIGDILGCGACLASLRRTRSGIFSEVSAVPLASIDEAKGKRLPEYIISLVNALPDLPVIYVDDIFAKKLKGGHQPAAETFNTYHIPSLAAGDMIKFVDKNNNLVSIAKLLYSSDQIKTLDGMKQAVKILRIFNND
ncbi:MAG TPA: tRNA pseudouridine(55) synthase TruB [Syntrophales bacterium]|nr:tRNA pseudouridine(55) synthase TruB [Syntrophales bacterium]